MYMLFGGRPYGIEGITSGVMSMCTMSGTCCSLMAAYSLMCTAEHFGGQARVSRRDIEVGWCARQVLHTYMYSLLIRVNNLETTTVQESLACWSHHNSVFQVGY